MNSKLLNNIAKNILVFFGLPILGVVVGFYLNQAYFKENQLSIQQWSLKKELIKEQYPYLIRLLRLTDISKNMAEIPAKKVFAIEGSNEVVMEVEQTFVVPSFCLEGGLQEEWHVIGNEIYKNRHKLNRELYYRFKHVYDFRYKYPFPESTKFSDLEKSPWAKKEIKAKWKRLNNELFLATKQYINMES